MAELAKGKLRNKIPQLQLALEGKLAEHQRLLLQLQQDRLDAAERDLLTLEQRIQQKREPYAAQPALLQEIPGVDWTLAAVISAELGIDMTVFQSVSQLASGAGVCPGNHPSAGQRKSTRIPKGNVYRKTALVEAANAAARTKGTYLRDKFYRLKARRGYQRAAVALAHKILVSIDHRFSQQDASATVPAADRHRGDHPCCPMDTALCAYWRTSSRAPGTVIGHDRRRILHFNITKHPTSSWIIQQLREAFPFGAAPRFLIHDRDAKYGTEVPAAIRSMKINALRTSFASPWQNGVAERWVRELPTRAGRPCDCSQRAAPEAAAFPVRLLPSRRPHAPWTGKGNAGVQNSLRELWSRAFPGSPGRVAPPLRLGGGLACPRAFPPILIISVYRSAPPFRGKRHGSPVSRPDGTCPLSEAALGQR